jgi:hypothetical protein
MDFDWSMVERPSAMAMVRDRDRPYIAVGHLVLHMKP